MRKKYEKKTKQKIVYLSIEFISYYLFLDFYLNYYFSNSNKYMNTKLEQLYIIYSVEKIKMKGKKPVFFCTHTHTYLNMYKQYLY